MLVMEGMALLQPFLEFPRLMLVVEEVGHFKTGRVALGELVTAVLAATILVARLLE
jgi:hypothetical protein